MEALSLRKEKHVLMDLLKQYISDKMVLKAIQSTPREEFLPLELRPLAYINEPLYIGYGQTISQPYIVALMCQLLELKPTDKVLEIGTGSGYQAAILGKLCKSLITIEVIPELAQKAEIVLRKLNYQNITVIQKNGREGYKPEAPYDKIICAATANGIPIEWKNQLKDGGKLVTPMIFDHLQRLILLDKNEEDFSITDYGDVRFVPLI